MKVSEIETFLVVAEESSFARAARKLCISEAQARRSVGLIERDLGARVFDAGSARQLRLTPLGRVLRDRGGHALDNFLRDCASMRADIVAMLDRTRPEPLNSRYPNAEGRMDDSAAFVPQLTGACPGSTASEVLRCGNLMLDTVRHRAAIDGRPLSLTAREFALLRALIVSEGAACSREWLISEVWGRSWRGAHSTLYVNMSALRTKLGRPGAIVTIRGLGYRLAVDELGAEDHHELTFTPDDGVTLAG